MRTPDHQVLTVLNREPRVVKGDYCSTARKAPGSCVYLDRARIFCRLYDDKLEKTTNGIERCFACLEDRGT